MNNNENKIAKQMEETSLNLFKNVTKDKKLVSVILLAIALRFYFSDDNKEMK